MFTGIIETVGEVTKIEKSGSNVSFWVKSEISSFLKPDQSVSHNGVCLTVEEVKGDQHKVTAIAETLKVSTLQSWNVESFINLERCMQMNGRLDGHIVQGHVDSIATCITFVEKNGSWEISFEIDPSYAQYLIEKGSISINGISLTIFNVTNESFTVAIIPYTYEHTSISVLKVSGKVNIEFDVIGKYVSRILSLKN